MAMSMETTECCDMAAACGRGACAGVVESTGGRSVALPVGRRFTRHSLNWKVVAAIDLNRDNGGSLGAVGEVNI